MSRARQAIILAAGRGSPLGAAGADQPKCLQRLAGRALLEWNLDALHSAGIQRIMLIGGWQADKLSGYPLELRVHDRWSQTQSVGSLLQAADWCASEESLVLYGDGAYSPELLAGVFDAPECDILVPGDRAWLAQWQLRFTDPLADAESWHHEGCWLRSIGRRIQSAEQASAQFAGLLRLSPAGWQRISALIQQIEHEEGLAAVDRLDMTALLARLLEQRVALACHLFDGGWVEVDSEHDLRQYETALAAGHFLHDFRPTEFRSA